MRAGTHEPRQSASPVQEDDHGLGPARPSDLSRQLGSIETAYRTLMRDYARVLGESSELARRRGGESEEAFEASARYRGLRRSVLYGPLLRLLVEAHVRKRLGELAARFAQLKATIDTAEEPSARSWLERALADMAETAASLRSLRLPGVFVIVPVLVALATAAPRFATDVPSIVWACALIIAVMLGWYLHRDLRAAYRRKREIFLEGAKQVDRQGSAEQRAHTGFNVYRDEEALFSAIALGRPLEVRIDAVIRRLSALLVAEVLLLGLAGSSTLGVIAGVGGVLTFAVDATIEQMSMPRLWR